MATALGLVAVVLAAAHGFYELQQGAKAPRSVSINAIGGTECEPSCLPALTVFPTFAMAGAATLLTSAVTAFWIARQLGKPWGRMGLLLLSVVLLVTGGGYVPPIIGIVGAVIVGLRRRS